MAAYRRVYDSPHQQADCQKPGSAPEFCNRVWANFLKSFFAQPPAYYVRHSKAEHFVVVPIEEEQAPEVWAKSKGKGSPYSITERRVPELIPVLGSQHAGDVSYKPGGRLPLLSARLAVTPATIKRAATNFAAW